MSDPKIPQSTPYVETLEPGTYFWCSCGQSSNQPYCDGSHKGTEFRPVSIEIESAQRVALCGCKHTGGPPMCDGSHKNL